MNGVIGMTGLLLDTDARPTSSGEYAEIVRSERRVAAGAHQRHPRLLQDRGGQARARDARLRPPRAMLDDVAATAGAARRTTRGSSSPAPSTPDVPVDAARRPGPPAPDPHQPRRQRASSSPTRARWSIRVTVERRADEPAVLRFAVRDTGIGIPRDKQRLLFQALHAGRRLDDAQVRRHRAGPGHLEAAGRTDGRRRSGVESEAGSGSHVLVHGAAAAMQPQRRARRPCRSRPICAELRVAGRRRQRHEPADPGRAAARRWGMPTPRRPSGAAALDALAQARGRRRPVPAGPARHADAGHGRRGAGRAIKADPRLPATRMVMLTSLGHAAGDARRCEANRASPAT